MKSTILIVDDVPQNIQVIAGHLGEEFYDLVMATSGEAALKAVEEDAPDLILLDVNMPGLNGFEVCSKIKKNNKLSGIPVIFLTARVDSEDIVSGFEAGAVDYVTKPFNKSELKARVKTHLELYHLKEELILKNELLLKASVTDPLTGLENRRGILEFLESERGRIKRGGKASGIILSDIDNFKSINDTYGHDAGDLILKNISNIMKNTIRINDHVARWGGEEFLFVLPEVSVTECRIVAEKIRAEIESYASKFNSIDIKTTITAGLSEFNIDNDIDQSIKIADKALYKGKKEGKNRVI